MMGAQAGPAAEAASTPRTLYQALFWPRSVAVIGQSNDAAKTAGRPLKFLRQAGFAGRIYPVNARHDVVLGERAWPSIEALPEVPEHAYVVTPVDAAVAAIEGCACAGVTVATVLTDGFAEVGPAGRAREARIADIVGATGMRVVGPSSLGIVNLRNGMMLTANAAFDEPDLPVGKIFAASHSGGMIGTLLSRGKSCGIGFAGLVSVGNEIDLSLGEICMAALDDAAIDGYLLFLETMRHADRLRIFAQCAAAAGKPVLAYKLGRSTEARELAATHTGALAGEDDAADAFLRDCGIARVETLSALIEGLPLLARIPAERRRRAPRVSVVTTTAGGAATVVDALASRGVEAAPPSAATQIRLAAGGIKAAPARVIDLTLAGVRYDVMKTALDVLATAPEFDLVIVVVGSSARFYPQLAVQPIIDAACAGSGTTFSGARGSDVARDDNRTPVAVFLVPEAPQARIALGKAGIANFYTPEACADAVAAALARRPPRVLPSLSSPLAGDVGERSDQECSSDGMAQAAPAPRPSPASGASGGGCTSALSSGALPHLIAAPLGREETKAGSIGSESALDELEAYALLDRLGIPRAPSLAVDIGDTLPELPFPYPVAVKALSNEIAHKSDVGGVALGLADAAALTAAVSAMRERLPKLCRVLVQPMIAAVGEALIGYRVDRDVGPLIMLAAGGIFAEIYRERSLRLAPIDFDTARDMIAEIRAFKMLTGYRGRPTGDLAALAAAAVALSRLAAEPAVAEAEINPLRVCVQGVVAVDALARIRVTHEFTLSSP